MIGVVVVTHADLGQGLLNAVSLIAGEQPNCRAIGLFHGDGIEEFEEKILAAIDELDEGEGVLVFTDFFGGTPSNTVMRCMAKREFRGITGVNMPMMVEALTDRDAGMSLEELEESCLYLASTSMMKLEDKYAENAAASDEEADDEF